MININITERVKEEYEKYPFPAPSDLTEDIITYAINNINNMKLDGKTVLDVGCGVGLYSSIFAKMGFKVKGIDVSEKSIELAKRLPIENSSFEIADLFNYKDSKKYDIVFCWDVLHHTKDARLGMKILSDFVNPNGYLVISIFNSNLYNERFARWIVRRFGNNIEDKLKFVKRHREILLFLVYLWKYKKYLTMSDGHLVDLFCHEHARYYSKSEVKKWFKENGFKVVNEDGLFQHTYIGRKI